MPPRQDATVPEYKVKSTRSQMICTQQCSECYETQMCDEKTGLSSDSTTSICCGLVAQLNKKSHNNPCNIFTCCGFVVQLVGELLVIQQQIEESGARAFNVIYLSRDLPASSGPNSNMSVDITYFLLTISSG